MDVFASLGFGADDEAEVVEEIADAMEGAKTFFVGEVDWTSVGVVDLESIVLIDHFRWRA